MILYCPVPSVTTVRVFSINAGLEASTVTPGSSAPEESLTTPAMDPCARAYVEKRRRTATTSDPSLNSFMLPPAEVAKGSGSVRTDDSLRGTLPGHAVACKGKSTVLRNGNVRCAGQMHTFGSLRF